VENNFSIFFNKYLKKLFQSNAKHNMDFFVLNYRVKVQCQKMTRFFFYVDGCIKKNLLNFVCGQYTGMCVWQFLFFDKRPLYNRSVSITSIPFRPCISSIFSKLKTVISWFHTSYRMHMYNRGVVAPTKNRLFFF